MGARAQHSPAYRKLCVLLRRWREDAGLTQRALASKLRRPPSFVPKSESGERRVDPIELLAWCKACGVTAADAIGQLERGS